MAKIIIGLVGPMASGKEVTKRYIEEKYNAKSCKFSTILRDVLDRLFVDKSRENIVNISTSLRETFGQDLLAKVIAKDSLAHDADIVVIDGVRRNSDIVYLMDLPNFYLVSIDALSEVRYTRMVLRNENAGDSEKTFDKFLEDHQLETETQIPEVMAEAKFSIDNTENGFEHLYEKIDKMMGEIKSENLS
jgi:dephospho-CoA kinase